MNTLIRNSAGKVLKNNSGYVIGNNYVFGSSIVNYRNYPLTFSSFPQQEFTVNFWVKNPPGTSEVLSGYINGSRVFRQIVSADACSLQVNYGAGAYLQVNPPGGLVSTEAMVTLRVSRILNQASIAIDGITSVVTAIDSTTGSTIDFRWSGDEGGVNCKVTNICLFNRMISADEIRVLWNNGAGNEPLSTVGLQSRIRELYAYENGTNVYLPDASGNGNNLVVNNLPAGSMSDKLAFVNSSLIKTYK